MTIDETRPLRNLMLASHLEAMAPEVRMAAANVDPDGTARIELLERLGDGWWNLTTEAPCTSAEMARTYDDVVLVHLPEDALWARRARARAAGRVRLESVGFYSGAWRWR